MIAFLSFRVAATNRVELPHHFLHCVHVDILHHRHQVLRSAHLRQHLRIHRLLQLLHDPTHHLLPSRLRLRVSLHLLQHLVIYSSPRLPRLPRSSGDFPIFPIICSIALYCCMNIAPSSGSNPAPMQHRRSRFSSISTSTTHPSSSPTPIQLRVRHAVHQDHHPLHALPALLLHSLRQHSLRQSRNHRHNAVQRPQLGHILQLFAHIADREFPYKSRDPRGTTLLNPLHRVLVDLQHAALLHFPHQALHIAHSEQPAHERARFEGFQVFKSLA